MRYATVTTASPPAVRAHDGDTTPAPANDWPDGMTFTVGDIVLIDTIGGARIIVARMASTP